MNVGRVMGISPICMKSCRCSYHRGEWGSRETVAVEGRKRKGGGRAGSLAEASWRQRRRRRQGNCACVPVIGHARGIDVVLTLLPHRLFITRRSLLCCDHEERIGLG